MCAKLCLMLYNPMDCSMSGFPVHHYLIKSAQTHVHWVSDVIQPSHLLSPSSPALNLSQHLDIFEWLSSLHQVAKALELQFQHQSFQWIFRIDFLWDWLGWNPCCPRDSQKSSQYQNLKASVLWLSACFMVQLSHLYMTTVNNIALIIRTFVGNVPAL